MSKLNDYSISFSGLSDGNHEFVYQLDDDFFSLIESSMIERGDLRARVLLKKTTTLLTFSFEIRGAVESLCDNCLGAIQVPIRYKGDLFVKFGPEYDEPSEDVVVVPYDEHEVNVAQWLYEFIIISLPIRKVHKKDKDGKLACDPLMLEKLSHHLVDRAPEDVENDEVDPRWAALKNLVDKNK